MIVGSTGFHMGGPRKKRLNSLRPPSFPCRCRHQSVQRWRKTSALALPQRCLPLPKPRSRRLRERLRERQRKWPRFRDSQHSIRIRMPTEAPVLPQITPPSTRLRRRKPQERPSERPRNWPRRSRQGRPVVRCRARPCCPPLSACRDHYPAASLLQRTVAVFSLGRNGLPIWGRN